MAKRKRKPSASQRDRNTIETAKYLKRVGVLSKQTKLHGGKFVSQRVAKKARQYSFVKAKNYTTIKVSKALAEKERAEGFEVVGGNRVIIPKDRRYREAIKQGKPVGVIPVKQGVFEVIPFPGDIFDTYSLVENIDELEKLKAPGEHFAFTLDGYRSFAAPINTAALLDYLQHYKILFSRPGEVNPRYNNEAIHRIVMYRMNPGDATAWATEGRGDRQRSKRESYGADGRRPKPRKGRAAMHPRKLARVREADAEKHRKLRAKMTDAQRLKAREQTRKRVHRYREKLKSESEKRGR